MTKLLPLLLLLLICANARAQTPVTGNIKDTLDKKTMANGVVTLLKKDSVLYRFTRTDRNGSFRFDNVAAGDYILLITFPKFADYAEPLLVKEAAVALGDIALTQKAQLLQAVVIKSGSAIRIKGDTTEFAADSFKVREGATVEDLLKKLPGFQVNSKGEITAQGQRVQKVLVDGEEFFGDDPTMATKNISARAVDKVQVFDTKTDQQQLTGATTGQEGKTVNIKLKEDQKRGGFGKYSAASDFSKYHELNALYNRFVGKKKFSVYGNKTNTSAGSLSWEDRNKLGIENDTEFDEVGGFYYSFGSSDGFDDWSLRGVPNAYTAGALFSNRWAADKQFMSGSYRFNRLGTFNRGSILTQNILPDTLFYTNQYTTQQNLNQQHALNGKWEWKPDSATTLKFTTATTRKTTGFGTATTSESLSEEKAFVNTGARTNEGTSSRLQSDNSLQITRKLKKAGRQLVARLRFNYTEDEQLSVLRFTNNFYKSNVIDSVEVGDQQKVFSGHSSTVGTKFTYVEPLSKKWSVIADYSFNLNSAVSNRNTFDKSPAGKYEMRNALLSNNFDMQAQSHAAGLLARYTTKKVNMTFGNGFSALRLKLLNKDLAKDTSYKFINLAPQANVRYTIKSNMNLSVRYNGNTIQPTLEQLQPIRNNNDPLNIIIGNPDLKVGFQNSYNLSYNFYKVLSQSGMYASLNYTTINNAVAYATTIDAKGRKVSQPVNVSGNHRWNVYSNYYKGEGPKKVNPSFNFNGNGGRTTNFVNALQNQTTYFNINAGIGARYEVEDKWNISIDPSVGYNKSKSSLNKGAVTSYVSYQTNINGFTRLPGKLELNSDAEINIVPRINAFAGANNVALWNAELSRKLLKKGAGKLSIVVHDILNNNRGVQRNINSNFVSDERFLRVSRYFLLKFELTFNKMGGGDN